MNDIKKEFEEFLKELVASYKDGRSQKTHHDFNEMYENKLRYLAAKHDKDYKELKIEMFQLIAIYKTKLILR